jgi:hypothetical protein
LNRSRVTPSLPRITPLILERAGFEVRKRWQWYFLIACKTSIASAGAAISPLCVYTLIVNALLCHRRWPINLNTVFSAS